MKRILIVLSIALLIFSTNSFAQDRATTLSGIDTNLPSSSKLTAAQLRTALKAITNSAFDGLDLKVNSADAQNPYTIVPLMVDTIIGKLLAGTYVKGDSTYKMSYTATKIVTHSATYAKVTSVWEFDETTGTNAVDSKSGHNGTLTNGVLNNQTGLIGKCLTLDGVDDYIGMGIVTDFNNITNNFSQSFWFKKDVGMTADGYLLKKAGSPDEQFALKLSPSGSGVYVKFIASNLSPYPEAGQWVGNANGNWVNIILTYSNGERKIYANGSLVSTTTFTGTITSVAGALILGSYNGTADNFNGSIDQVSIWNGGVWDQTDVDRIYNLGAGKLWSEL